MRRMVALLEGLPTTCRPMGRLIIREAAGERDGRQLRQIKGHASDPAARPGTPLIVIFSMLEGTAGSESVGNASVSTRCKTVRTALAKRRRSYCARR